LDDNINAIKEKTNSLLEATGVVGLKINAEKQSI
jgi:hypothetical protein